MACGQADLVFMWSIKVVVKLTLCLCGLSWPVVKLTLRSCGLITACGQADLVFVYRFYTINIRID